MVKITFVFEPHLHQKIFLLELHSVTFDRNYSFFESSVLHNSRIKQTFQENCDKVFDGSNALMKCMNTAILPHNLMQQFAVPTAKGVLV